MNCREIFLFIFSPLALSLASCVSMRKLTAQGTASIAPLGESASRESQNADLVVNGMPSSILMLEASFRADESNQDIVLQLAKAYQALATTKFETELLLLGDARGDSAISDATSAHERAVFYSRKYLEMNGVRWSGSPEDFSDSLKGRSGDQNIIDAAFVAATGLKSIIAINGKRTAFLVLLPRAQRLTEFACSGALTPRYPPWSCAVMRAIELAETPALAGGDLRASKSLFEETHQKHPRSLMPLALWAEHLLKIENNPTDWDRIKAAAAAYRKSARDRILETAGSDTTQSRSDDEAFLNSVALRRVDYMIAREKTFFGN